MPQNKGSDIILHVNTINGVKVSIVPKTYLVGDLWGHWLLGDEGLGWNKPVHSFLGGKDLGIQPTNECMGWFTQLGDGSKVEPPKTISDHKTNTMYHMHTLGASKYVCMWYIVLVLRLLLVLGDSTLCAIH